MVHNQIQQVQQRISGVNQLVSQLHQSEENTRQKLMHLAQEEAYVAQQLQRAQQMCQESMSGLQSISGSLSQQSISTGFTQTPLYGQGLSTGTSIPSISQSSPGMNFDLSTMNPDTYQNTMQFMGGQGYSGVSGQSSIPSQSYGVGPVMGTGSSLSSISTMGPDTYQASREQLGKSPANLNQIGQQAGISPNNKLI